MNYLGIAVLLLCSAHLTPAQAQDNIIFHNQLAASDQAYAQGNYNAAVLLVRPLAEAGNRDAQHKLGVLISEGKGLEQNVVEAVSWFQKAAEQGYPNALHSLGLVYAKGEGVNVDLIEAIKWFLLARRAWSGAQLNPSTADAIQRTGREASIVFDRLLLEGRAGVLKEAFGRARAWQEAHSVVPAVLRPHTYQDFLFMTAGEATRYCEHWFESLRDPIGKTLRVNEAQAVANCSHMFSTYLRKLCTGRGYADHVPVGAFAAFWHGLMKEDRLSALPFVEMTVRLGATAPICPAKQGPSASPRRS
jgi:hypothetical protein